MEFCLGNGTQSVYCYDAAQFFANQRKRMPHHAIRQSIVIDLSQYRQP